MYSDHIEKISPEDILEKQDLPRIVIISVSIFGAILLLINVGLVAGCVFKKRSKRIRGLYKMIILFIFRLFVDKVFN